MRKSSEMRVLFLMCCLFSLGSLDEAPNLRLVTSHLSVVSRLASGICIQNELSEKKTTETQVVANMIQSNNPKVLEDIKGTQSSEASKKLTDLSGVLKSIGPATIEKSHQLRKTLETLPDLLNQVDQVETASQKTLTDDLKKNAAAITGGKIDIRETSVGKYNLIFIANVLEHIFDESLTEVPTDDTEIFKLKSSILRFRTEMDGYQAYVDNLKKYKNESLVTDLLAFTSLNLDEVLEPVKELEDFAMKYDRSKLGTSHMIVWLKALVEEIDKVEASNFLNIQEDMDALLKDLDSLFPVAKDLSKVEMGSKSTQLSDIFKTDLSSPWFLENFAEKEKKSLEKLKTALAPLESFNGKVIQVIQGLTDFSTNYDEFKVYSLRRVVKKVKDSIEKANEYKKFSSTIKKAVENSVACLETSALKYPRKEINLNEFNKAYTLSMDLHKKITFMQESVDQALAIPEIENVAILDLLKAEISDDVNKKGFRMTTDEAWEIIGKMRNVTDAKAFVENFLKAGNLLAEVDSSGLDKLLAETMDFEIVQTTQDILKNTNVITGLQCLKNGNDSVFNPEHSLKLMEFVDKFRSLKEEDILEAIGILEKMGKIKEGLVNLEMKKSKRAAGKTAEKELLKFENLKKISTDLEQGVDTLKNILKVVDKKEKVLAATNFGEKVDRAVLMIRMPPMQSVWTPTTRQKIQKVYTEIEQLEKATVDYTKAQELETIFGIMKNATIVNGLELDTNLFQNTVPSSLEASSDSDVRAAAPTFKELGSLDLNFVAHHSSLNAAAMTFEPLRKFFDDFFGIDRSPHKNASAQQQQDAGSTAGPQSIHLLLLSGLIILLLVLFIVIVFCYKRKSRLRKLNYKETWRHLRFLIEGAVTKNEGTQYTQLHLAVLRKRYDEVKRLVKNGAYVDVHCFGKINETPLHTAVSNKSTEIVKLLIKSGADLNALDGNYETPLDRAKSNKEIQKILKDSQNKKIRKNLPQVLPVDKYKIFIDEDVKGKKDFAEHFKANIVTKIDKATHVIVKTGKGKTYEMDKEDPSALKVLAAVCSPKLLMSSDWMAASLEKSKNFRDDHLYQVQKIKFNGKTYKGIDDIQLAHSKLEVPFLTNTIVYFDQADLHTIDWSGLKGIASELGAQTVDEFPVMQGMMSGQCPYYREDLGHIFVVYNQSNAEKMTTMYPILKTEKAYTFLEKDEFIALILNREVSHKKLKGIKGGKKDSKSKQSKSKSSEKSGDSYRTTGGTTRGTTGGNSASGSVTPANGSATPTPISNTPSAAEEHKSDV
ncbi:hypothetical protein L5515_011011 [Caenorhabditis briggsae]|uniref:Domain of unknown function WSN domain-containing protein n=1 Tax=Caenorhabditis briggsae TaxID=6238 RepID=A0AAE9ERT4_CAEBR|nr:hypothetical protein L5515_011011 [Caenorhabditis briggsae]